MAETTLGIKIAAEDAFSGVFKTFGNSISSITGLVSAPINAIGGISGAISGIGTTLSIFGAAVNGFREIGNVAKSAGDAIGIGIVSEMEQVKAQMIAFTGSGEEASRVMADIRKEADATPFSFKELASATASLIPASKMAGVSLMDLTKQAEVLGALNPEQGLVGAAMAIREAVSGDFGSVVDRFNLPRQRLNELKEQGVPAVEAIRIALAELGVDGSLVANMATTLTGRWSTFNDTIDSLKVQVAAPLFDQLKIGLEIVSNLINDNREVFDEWSNTLGDIFGGIGQEINGFIVTVKNIANADGVDVFTAMITALELRIGEVFGSSAQDAFHGFTDLISDLKVTANILWEALSEVATFIIGTLVGNVNSATGPTKTFGQTMTDVGVYVKQSAVALKELADTFISATPQGELMRKVVEGLLVAFITWKAAVILSAIAVEGYNVVLGISTAAKIAWTNATLIAQAVGIGFTAVMSALNFVLNMNPIGLVILGITAFIGILAIAYRESETFRNIVDAAFKMLSEGVTVAIEKAQQIIAAFVTFFSGTGPEIGARALEIGRAIVEGIVNGITGLGKMAVDAVINLAGSIINGARKALRSESPSQEFFDIGADITAGLATGIEETTAVATEAGANLADAIGAVMPVVLTRQQAEIAKFRADEGKAASAYQRQVEDATQNHEQKLSDLQIDFGKAKKDQKAAVLEKIADENKSFQRKLEDMEVGHTRKLEDINSNHADKMAEIAQSEAENRFKALQSLTDGVSQVENDVASALEQVGTRTGEKINAAIADASAAIAETTQRATEQINAAQQNLDLSREIRGRRQEFSAGQTADSDARKRAKEDADLQKKLTEDAATFEARTAQDRATLDAKVSTDAATLKRKRDREDADAKYKTESDVTARQAQLSRDLVGVTSKDEQDKIKAKASADIQDIQARAALQVKDKQRSRALDDADLAIKVAQDRQYLTDKQNAEREALTQKQAKEKQALADRRAADDEDRAYRAGQQQAAQDFTDLLENEALQRQITRIETDRNTRIDNINNALTEKQRLIGEDAKKEVENIVKTSGERIAKLKTEFFDKVGPLADEAKGKIEEYISGVQGRIAALQAAAVAAASAVAAVGGGGGSSASENNVGTGINNAVQTLLTTLGTTVGTIANTTIEQGRGRGGAAEGARSMAGGSWLVGERGPEILEVPGGSNVYNNGDSRRMLGGGTDDNRPVVINLDGQTIARTTWKHLKRLNLQGATLGLT